MCPPLRSFFPTVGALVSSFLAFSAPVSAQQPLQSVHGVVRSSSGTTLGGADVVVGPRSATTNPQGLFRVDSLRPGQYAVTIRLVGFSPVRSRVVVVASEPTEVEYFLTPAPYLLPAVLVESRRTGIYGAVGDTGYRAISGARVQVQGWQGGEVRTDSMGRFAFPLPGGRQYMVRVTFPGYTERRFVVELKRGGGRELAVLLAPFSKAPSRADDIAVEDLGRRLAMGLERERLTAQQLERYSSLPLCELPNIRSQIGRDRNDRILFVLNGVTADAWSDFDVICSWRADEVELVEFGNDVCRDVTQTIPMLIGIWCSGRTRRSLTNNAQRMMTQPGGMKYVIVWEKK